MRSVSNSSWRAYIQAISISSTSNVSVCSVSSSSHWTCTWFNKWYQPSPSSAYGDQRSCLCTLRHTLLAAPAYMSSCEQQDKHDFNHSFPCLLSPEVICAHCVSTFSAESAHQKIKRGARHGAFSCLLQGRCLCFWPTDSALPTVILTITHVSDMPRTQTEYKLMRPMSLRCATVHSQSLCTDCLEEHTTTAALFSCV